MAGIFGFHIKGEFNKIFTNARIGQDIHFLLTFQLVKILCLFTQNSDIL